MKGLDRSGSFNDFQTPFVYYNRSDFFLFFTSVAVRGKKVSVRPALPALARFFSAVGVRTLDETHLR